MPAQVLAAESGVGIVMLDDLENIVRVFAGEGGGVVLRAGADGGGAE